MIPTSPRRLCLVVLPAIVLATLAGAVPTASAHSGITGVVPQSVTRTLGPGSTTTVPKVVHTSPVPPNPDIVFLADTTGSMGPAIANVKAGVGNIMNQVVAAQPSAQFGAAEYEDFNCPSSAFGFQLNQAVTPSKPAVQAAVNTWSAAGNQGCDVPEAQLFALHQLATNPAVGFRAGSTRIVAWFGDAPGHDPSNGVTLNSTIAALTAAGIRVVAVNTPTSGNPGLNSTGQATAITTATGGKFLNNVPASQVAQAILDGIKAIEVTVTPQVAACSSRLSVTFTPASRKVKSGDDAAFSEKLTVASGTPAGTLTCTVNWLVDGKLTGPEFVQRITVLVPGISINDVSVVEGDAGFVLANFTVSLSTPSPVTVTVNFATADGTATANDDYVPTSGTVTFLPGQTTQTVTVQVKGDLVDELNETFRVNLSMSSRAAITDRQGVGTIIDDDRNGEFSCRASALRLGEIEPVVANPPNVPCLDDHQTLASVNLSGLGITASSATLDALTDQTPDDLESSPPAAGDNSRSEARTEQLTIDFAGNTITADVVASQAMAQCVAGPGGLAPQLTSSSTIVNLKINGIEVAVTSDHSHISVGGVATLHLNHVSTTSKSVTRQAIRLEALGLSTVVVSESKADFRGTLAHPSGSPCEQ